MIKYFIVLLLLIASVSAFDNIGTYRTNENLNLNLGCSYNNTYCPSTFSCNITIFNEAGTVINNQLMSTTNYPTYNYSISKSLINITGLYYGRQVCCGSIGCNDYSFEFKVNAQGKEYGTIEGIIYIILFAILGVMLSVSVYASLKIQWRNNRSQSGNVVSVNWMKYGKMVMFAVSYILFLGIVYLAYTISLGILEFTEMGKLFFVFYRLLFALTIPTMAFLFVMTLVMFVNDKNIEKNLTRGLTVR